MSRLRPVPPGPYDDLAEGLAQLGGLLRVNGGPGFALGRLQAAGVARQLVDFWTAALVRDARDEGASWADVGAALGVTRQSAWERYGVPS